MTRVRTTMSERALGKGLSALMGDIDINNILANKHTAVDYMMLPIHVLCASALQPRKTFDKESLENLAESIKSNGIIQPLVVRKSPDAANSFEIIAGERRWRAAILAGVDQVPAIIRDLDDQDVLKIAIIENVQRQDLNIIEEAEGYKKLMSEFGYTQEQLSEILGKSRSHIANVLRLLCLPETVIEMLKKNVISFGHARALINAPNAEQIAQQIARMGLSVRQTEKLLKKTTGLRRVEELEAGYSQVSDLRDIEQLLQQATGLKVQIDGNCVKIYYNNNMRALDQLVMLLNTAETTETNN